MAEPEIVRMRLLKPVPHVVEHGDHKVHVVTVAFRAG